MKVGFIGLGAMGRPMASNLIAAGHSVTVYDLSTAAVDALVEQVRVCIRSRALRQFPAFTLRPCV